MERNFPGFRHKILTKKGAVMLLNILSGGFRNAIISLLLTMPIILFSLSLHETAHGWVAYKCGDRTAYNLGRLTLNPMKHLDPLGFVVMLVFGFGWAKPVPINTRNFTNPKKGMALSAAAGPLSNFLLGILNAVLWGTFAFLAGRTAPGTIHNLLAVFALFFELGAQINILFSVFNLIPIPPFDGSRLALVFLPPKAYFGIMKYEKQIMFGVLIAMLVLSRIGLSPFGWIADKLSYTVANGIYKLLYFNLP